MLSHLGYWEFFRTKGKISIYFLPIFTIAFQFFLLFSSGLLNFLEETAFFIYLFGFLLLFKAVSTKEFIFLKSYSNLTYVFLAAALVIVSLAVKGTVFAHYDNFSHWAIVVRKLLENDRLPNFADKVILFQNYPLGSSIYIYYFCKLTNSSESTQMLAQAFIMICAVLPWFQFIRRNTTICCIFILFAVNFLFCYNISIFDLLVDTLLPLVGMASFLFVCQEILDNPDFTPKRIFYAIPLLLWTAQIKNSGLLFSLFAALPLFLKINNRTFFFPILLSSASPFIGNFLWNRHCNLVFDQASASLHAMTRENFISIFSLKTPQNIHHIISDISSSFFNRNGFYSILIWLAILGIITFCFFKRYQKQYLVLLLIITCMHVIYFLGLLGMYVFSMPLEEALRLAGMDRYAKTLDIAAYYLIFIYTVLLLSKIKICNLETAICTILIGLVLGSSHIRLNGFTTFFYTPDTASRMAFESAVEEYGVPGNLSYFICIPETDYGYYNFLCAYLLDEFPSWNVITNSDQLDSLSDYYVLINFDTENPIIQNWLQKNHPDKINDPVIYLF